MWKRSPILFTCIQKSLICTFICETFDWNLNHSKLLKSADYWNRAHVPERIYKSLGPKMKFLVMLRDPVERLHSDYNFNVSFIIFVSWWNNILLFLVVAIISVRSVKISGRFKMYIKCWVTLVNKTLYLELVHSPWLIFWVKETFLCSHSEFLRYPQELFSVNFVAEKSVV